MIQFANMAFVIGHLRTKLLQVSKFFFAANAFQECHFKLPAVQVGVEIQDIGLY